MMPVPDRPRERLRRLGSDALPDAELIALVLGTRSLGVATQIINKFKDLGRLAGAGVGELAALRGVGEARAFRLKAALALAGRLGQRPFRRGDPMQGPHDVYERVGRRLALLEKEVFVALALDRKNRVLAELRVAEGGTCNVDIVPRDVFRVLVREAASGAVFLHNHPSGDPTPSAADLELTDLLRRAGNLVGVTVVDHVVAAVEGYRAHSEGWRA